MGVPKTTHHRNPPASLIIPRSVSRSCFGDFQGVFTALSFKAAALHRARAIAQNTAPVDSATL
jgi:hypothetical protein